MFKTECNRHKTVTARKNDSLMLFDQIGVSYCCEEHF